MRPLAHAFIAATLVGATLLCTAHAQSPPPPPTAPTAAKATDRDAHYRSRLAVQWTGVTLNMIGADVLALYIPGAQEEVVEVVGGEDRVRWAMLGGAAIYQVPISMIVASQLLPPKAARWSTVGGAVVSAITIVGLGDDKPHYVLIAAAELALITGAVVTAARWGRKDRPDGASLGQRRVVFTPHLDPRWTGLTVSGRL